MPPVPSPRVKSPPWIMKSFITRWNLLPLYVNFSPSWKKQEFFPFQVERNVYVCISLSLSLSVVWCVWSAYCSAELTCQTFQSASGFHVTCSENCPMDLVDQTMSEVTKSSPWQQMMKCQHAHVLYTYAKTLCQLHKIVHRLGNCFAKQANDNFTNFLISDRHVKVNLQGKTTIRPSCKCIWCGEWGDVSMQKGVRSSCGQQKTRAVQRHWVRRSDHVAAESLERSWPPPPGREWRCWHPGNRRT